MTDEMRVSFAVPVAESNFEEPEGPDGPLIIHNVPIMVEGIWKGMNGRQFQFTAEDLKANFDKWLDNLVWTRHELVPGENRPATDSIGAVPNRYFEPKFSTVLEDGTTYTAAAAMGDVLLHRKTDESRGAASLIRLPKDQGGFRMVSAEMAILDPVYDEKSGIYRSKNYAFRGLTIQRQGGCRACNIPAFAAPGLGVDNMADEKESQAPPAPGGGEEKVPKWALDLHAKLDKLLEMETAEAQGKGEQKPPAQAGMAAQTVPVEQFTASQTKVKELEESNRKLQAIVDKANGKPGETQTMGAQFGAAGSVNAGGVPSPSISKLGNTVSFRRRD